MAITTRSEGRLRAVPGVRFWLALALILSVGFLAAAKFAHDFGVPFADTYTYLDPVRNWLAGRGFVTRFNVVHGWSGHLERPAIAYYNPLYSLLLGAIWFSFDDPTWTQVVGSAVPATIAAFLLALLVRRRFGSVVALLSAGGYFALPSTWKSFEFLSVEHVAMVALLGALHLFDRLDERSRAGWSVLGAYFAVAMLLKVTLALAIPGLLLAELASQGGSLRERVAASVPRFFRFGIGFVAVMAPFQIYCWQTAHEFYPSYPSLAKNWSLASLFGGNYVAGSPAVVPRADLLPGTARYVEIVLENIRVFVRSLAGELSLFAAFLPAGIAMSQGRARRLTLALLLVGVSLSLGHACSFYWARLSAEITSELRYSTFLSIPAYPVGVFGLVATLRRLIVARERRWAYAAAAWLIASTISFVPVLPILRTAAKLTQPRVISGKATMVEAAQHIGPDDLAAIGGGGLTIGLAVFLDRPVIALPQQRMDTAQTMREFFDIFDPALVISDGTRNLSAVLSPDRYHDEPIRAAKSGVVYVRNDRR